MLLILAPYLYKRHLGARNLADWLGIKYLFDSLICKSINNFFEMHFSGFFCFYSVSHCSNKPTIKMIDWSFLCQWANVQNQQGIKYFFPPRKSFQSTSPSLHHLLSAFHILKDATIQLTVEKFPVDENLHFTFSSEEPYQSTGLMKVEGRFVDPIQVKHYTNA